MGWEMAWERANECGWIEREKDERFGDKSWNEHTIDDDGVWWCRVE
jgi:hypothetical protein